MPGLMQAEVSATQAVAGGLLSVVPPVITSDPRVGAEVAWQASPGGPAGITDALCDLPTALSSLADAEKTLEEPDEGYAPPFGIYRAFECMPGELDYLALARDGLGSGESMAIEDILQALYYEDTALLTPTDSTPTPGTAVSIAQGLAILEQWFASGIGMQGLIHASRYGAHLLGSQRGVNASGGLLETIQGTPIVNGSGYSDVAPSGSAVVAAGGEFWAWATGPVDIFLGPVLENKGYNLPINKETAVAERMGSIVVRGGVTAVLIDPSL